MKSVYYFGDGEADGKAEMKNLLGGKGANLAEMINLDISSKILNEDKAIVEDLIKAAHNNAKSQLKSKTSEEISKVTGGFGVPDFKWPL